VGSRSADHLGAIGEDPAEEDGRDSETETIASQNTDNNREPGFPSRPYWLDDEGLKKGEVEVLSMQEELFWKDLLEKYLYPIDEDKAEKVFQLLPCIL
jgi:chitin synthase